MNVIRRVSFPHLNVAFDEGGHKVGVMVDIEDTIKGFNMILDGECDDIPEQAFLNVGTIEDAIEKSKTLLSNVNDKN